MFGRVGRLYTSWIYHFGSTSAENAEQIKFTIFKTDNVLRTRIGCNLLYYKNLELCIILLLLN